MDPSVVLQDGVSYGPAMARRTRTPIEFKEGSDPGLQGETNPGNQLQFLASLAPMLEKMKPAGTITIYPKSDLNRKPGEIGKTITHEEVHALMGGIDSRGRLLGQGFSQFNPSPEQVSSLSPYIKDRYGDMNREIPAYATEQGVFPEDQRQSFIQSFVQKLASSNPKAAQIYKSLTQGGGGQ